MGLSGKELDKAIGRIALQVQKEIKVNCPVQTGRLRNSIVVTKNTEGEWVVGTNLDYAEYVELGVRPHTIVPKNKKALFWEGAKHPVKKVEHPGFEGKFMFLSASKKVPSIAKKELSKVK